MQAYVLLLSDGFGFGLRLGLGNGLPLGLHEQTLSLQSQQSDFAFFRLRVGVVLLDEQLSWNYAEPLDSCSILSAWWWDLASWLLA